MPLANGPLGPIGDYQVSEYENLIYNFPAVFDQAQSDLIKYQLAVDGGFISETNRVTVLEWFNEFPDLWDAIKDNWYKANPDLSQAIDYRNQAFYNRVDTWVNKIRETFAEYTLGIAPIIIGVFIIAGIFGIAGAIWAVAYVKEQNNISNIIDQAVAGNISEDVLMAALAKSEKGPLEGFLDRIGDIGMIAITGAIVYKFWPQISSFVRRAFK